METEPRRLYWIWLMQHEILIKSAVVDGPAKQCESRQALAHTVHHIDHAENSLARRVSWPVYFNTLSALTRFADLQHQSESGSVHKTMRIGIHKTIDLIFAPSSASADPHISSDAIRFVLNELLAGGLAPPRHSQLAGPSPPPSLPPIQGLSQQAETKRVLHEMWWHHYAKHVNPSADPDLLDAPKSRTLKKTAEVFMIVGPFPSTEVAELFRHRWSEARAADIQERMFIGALMGLDARAGVLANWIAGFGEEAAGKNMYVVRGTDGSYEITLR